MKSYAQNMALELELTMKKHTEQAATEQQDCPWESGALGDSIQHAVPVAKGHAVTVDESLGMQMISIRLPKSLIDDLKYFAEREGLGYQPLMRRVLKRFVDQEYKMIALHQFGKKEIAEHAGHDGEEELPEPMTACR